MRADQTTTLAPVTCVTCGQMVSDAHDAGLVEALVAHQCTPSTVYLLHFLEPTGNPANPRAMAQHYIGKPASSGLLKVGWRICGGEFAELAGPGPIQLAQVSPVRQQQPGGDTGQARAEQQREPAINRGLVWAVEGRLADHQPSHIGQHQHQTEQGENNPWCPIGLQGKADAGKHQHEADAGEQQDYEASDGKGAAGADSVPAALDHRSSPAIATGCCCATSRRRRHGLAEVALPTGALPGDATPAATYVPEDVNMPAQRGRAAQRASHAPIGPATPHSTA
jgi:hypothetical protein